MKRHGKLWSSIIDLENLKNAHKAARIGKSFYQEVQAIDAAPGKWLQELHSTLATGQFTTSAYTLEEQHDGRKVRTIHKLPYYPDRIVQHALLNIIGPPITKSFIRDTYQSIKGRGTSDAMRRVRSVVTSAGAPKYALKIDINKYYPSVVNRLLKLAVRKKIKCAPTLRLVDNIIDSTQGLPIGNYTSQLFGNLYLNEFDWWMQQHSDHRGYFRYCDDMVVMADTKAQLHLLRGAMTFKLRCLGLQVKSNWCIYDLEKQGVDFVGYVFQPLRTRLRRSLARSFRAKMRSAEKRLTGPKGLQGLSSVAAFKGWCAPVNAKMLWRKNVTRGIVRRADRLRLKSNPLKGAI